MDGTTAWNGEVEADYFQFYVQRQGADHTANEVPDDGFRDRLWTNGQFVVVGTLRQWGTVPLKFNLCALDPGQPEPIWQHVAEVSLEAGGPLEVFDWDYLDPITVQEIPSGPVRLRASWIGLRPNGVNQMGMDEEGRSDERIELHLWPASESASRVIRRWDGWPD